VNVKPDELANVCAIFSVLRTDRIAHHQLELYVAKCLLLDSCVNPVKIIDECIQFKLLLNHEKEFVLTDLGRLVAKQQQSTSSQVTDSARESLLRNVYLNTKTMTPSCQSFFHAFHVDPLQGTFIYDRSPDDDLDVTKWLRIFYRVGLIHVNSESALIRHERLGLFNAVLAKLRGVAPTSDIEEAIDKDDIGDFAEERAVEYEVKRLRANGYPDLALLVQRISLVDKSAGYDVISRKGSGKNPEKVLFIEVKGTTKAEVSFIWSRNERRVAEQKGKSYWIYVFTNVDLLASSSEGPVRVCDPAQRLQKLGYTLEPWDVQVYRTSHTVDSV